MKKGEKLQSVEVPRWRSLSFSGFGGKRRLVSDLRSREVLYNGKMKRGGGAQTGTDGRLEKEF